MNIKDSQNFLTDSVLVEKLIKLAQINKNDIVLEIGAGKGIITQELAKTAYAVKAVEVDAGFNTYLEKITQKYKNVEIINKNFLEIQLPDNPYKVFSNIPFNITSDIINKLYFGQNAPQEAYLIMQKEAAHRFMGKNEGIMISLLLKPFFDMEIVYEFKKSDFNPQPGVDTVFFKLVKKENPLVDKNKASDYENFIIYTLYQQKPTLKYRLNKIFSYKQFSRLSKDLKFNPDITADKVTDDQWLGLFDYFLTGVSVEKKNLTVLAKNRYLSDKSNQNRQERTKIRL